MQALLHISAPFRSGGFRYWHKATQTTTHGHNHYWRAPQAASSDVEMTSYVLLTYAAMNDSTGGLDVMKWVASQRNPNGGYASTQVGWSVTSVFTVAHVDGDVAQLVERRIGTLLTQLRFPGATRDFSPGASFQCRLSYGVRTPPCAIACIYICAHV